MKEVITRETIHDLVESAGKRRASDIHFLAGIPLKFRIDGELSDASKNIVTEKDCLEIAKVLSGDRYAVLEESGELDLAETFGSVRCRIHIYKARGIPHIALRLLHEKIPPIDTIGIPKAAVHLLDRHKGIILITGETGSGKTTTLASMLNEINHRRKDHIVTLEDPIEYLHTPDQCAISQREIGTDLPSFAAGVRASLREDPNVILIGEMRDRETIETAITAAETGHLVLSTLHTGTASDSIDRIIQTFPEGEQQQIRLQLSMVLLAVLTQELVPKTGGGRVLACELMVCTDAIRNLIREGDTPQIANAIATSAAVGGITMDQSLIRLAQARKISKDTAFLYGHDLEFLKKYIHK